MGKESQFTVKCKIYTLIIYNFREAYSSTSDFLTHL